MVRIGSARPSSGLILCNDEINQLRTNGEASIRQENTASHHYTWFTTS